MKEPGVMRELHKIREEMAKMPEKERLKLQETVRKRYASLFV